MEPRLRLLQRLQSQFDQFPSPEAEPLRRQFQLALELRNDVENEARFDSLFSKILISLLSEHRALLGPLKREIASEAIQCADEALAFYGSIKAERPLTEEEKQKGQVFIGLMESAQKLLKL